MIPKIIHYCWFGGNPLSESALRCIESWKKYLPDYEIKEWNESNCDFGIVPYVYEAYRLKKWAFVSDYFRFLVLYNYGGIYFDTDVEVIKPLDDIILNGSFMGAEKDEERKECREAVGLGMGFSKGHPFLKTMLDTYQKKHVIVNSRKRDFSTVVDLVSDILSNKGVVKIDEVQSVDGIMIYPPDYFCPMDYKTRKIKITSNTRTIHHYDGSWVKKINLGKTLWEKEADFWRSLGQIDHQVLFRLSNFFIRRSYNIYVCSHRVFH